MRPGPWEHRFVAANGARFHVVLAGPQHEDAPLVVLLHGFPQFWWAWRHQLTALGRTGHRVVAMDLRGFGASDRPPRGYTAPTLAADVSAVIRSLGAERAVIAGHGIGGSIAWALAYLHADLVRAIAVLAAPHPLPLLRQPARLPLRTAALVAAMNVPGWAERGLQSGELVTKVLTAGSAPGREIDAEELAVYRDVITDSPIHSQAEYLHWLARTAWYMTGRRYRASLAGRVGVPVLSLRGAADRFLPEPFFLRDGEHTLGEPVSVTVEHAGHFLPEEAPDAVSSHLAELVGSLPAT